MFLEFHQPTLQLFLGAPNRAGSEDVPSRRVRRLLAGTPAAAVFTLYGGRSEREVGVRRPEARLAAAWQFDDGDVHRDRLVGRAHAAIANLFEQTGVGAGGFHGFLIDVGIRRVTAVRPVHILHHAKCGAVVAGFVATGGKMVRWRTGRAAVRM